jgi:hypothetical protein
VGVSTAVRSGRRKFTGDRNSTRAAINQIYVDELNEDLDGMEKALTDLGVKVLRPLELPEQTGEVTTLDWSASVVPLLKVRDNTIVLGDEILETAPMVRSRHFETGSSISRPGSCSLSSWTTCRRAPAGRPCPGQS